MKELLLGSPLATMLWAKLPDQTGRELLTALSRLAGVNVTVVRVPARQEFPASGNAPRQPALRS